MDRSRLGVYTMLEVWYVGVMDETTNERYLAWCDLWGADYDDPTMIAWYLAGPEGDLPE